ncbi:hypothetical protein MKQ68_18770 [Chitinophaga horti]|uniref:Uncharacterized protein n=1 Tax=Chitinophaga horti TaxID=2920382 RepID=A0ABY6IXL7_9BACT|nr:hypothetical protein [Chitinophaga horti]UYQ92134.1 hypothetical protein MKQ68_18770 [Chitinophaga horti]
MKPYRDITLSFAKLASKANNIDEHWGFICVAGTNEATVAFDVYKELTGQIKSYIDSFPLTFEINGVSATQEDIETYEQTPSAINNWKISLNKLPLIRVCHADGWRYNFFLNESTCLGWLQKQNPLLSECIFNSGEKNCIIVNNLSHCFGGVFTSFTSTDEKMTPRDQAEFSLPDRKKIRESLRIVTDQDISIFCPAYEVRIFGSSKLSQEFVNKASLALATSLLSEYYSFEKVIIDGFRRIELKLDDEKSKATEAFYRGLLELVDWIYSDRITIRKKLFHERLSLELSTNDSFVEALSRHSEKAIKQAKERYNFVIIDRKDAYLKELKELLKDVRAQSDLYANKLRSLLSNFLRDLLAALILIGFTIFTKFKDNQILEDIKLLDIVFFGLSIYYTFSVIMQSIVDTTDILISKRELTYWKNVTKELMPEEEFNHHIENALNPRRKSFIVIYMIVALGYIAIAISCYKFPMLLRNKSNEQSKQINLSTPSTHTNLSAPDKNKLEMKDSLFNTSQDKLSR